jgi:acetylornithine deacetylase/succinyl-diaminopimelate desuccinylase-like protein
MQLACAPSSTCSSSSRKNRMTDYERLDAWIDAHFDEEVRFLQELVRVPTDTPPGNNAPHAERTAELLQASASRRRSIRCRRRRCSATACIDHQPDRAAQYGAGRTVALNAHGDVVPPGDGWTHDPTAARSRRQHLRPRRRGEQERLRDLHLRACARSSRCAKLKGSVELHFTYDEEFGGELGPGWLLAGPDQARPADRRRLQLRGGDGAQRLPADGSDGARQDGARRHPDTGVDALQAAVQILNALYAQNRCTSRSRRRCGHHAPYLNVGRIEGGTNTNVVPGKVVFKLDRRMIPEENPARSKPRSAR